jgi:8-oxo-dGTP pyrophosphatase MutT (NUDIX family)
MQALRSELLKYLETFCTEKVPYGLEQKNITEKFIDFIDKNPKALYRENLVGHVTGSALVFNLMTGETQVLLTLHAKLNMWLQLGGHADGETDLKQVALRETEEESGLTELSLITSSLDASIFDLDIHWIPPHKNVPGHYHYDVRYLVRTSTPEKIQINSESKRLEWFILEKCYSLTSELSMHRQFDKLEWYLKSSRGDNALC